MMVLFFCSALSNTKAYFEYEYYNTAYDRLGYCNISSVLIWMTSRQGQPDPYVAFRTMHKHRCQRGLCSLRVYYGMSSYIWIKQWVHQHWFLV